MGSLPQPDTNVISHPPVFDVCYGRHFADSIQTPRLHMGDPMTRRYFAAVFAAVLLTGHAAYSQQTAQAQNIPPSHYLKVYWLAKDNTVNFMVVDDDNKYKVYTCEMHGRTMRTCTTPLHTYVVVDFSQAAIPQKPANARTVYYVAQDGIGEATSIRELTLDESVDHALHNPFGREDR